MEAFDERKKKETEIAKAKFEMTKTKIREIASRSSKVEAEYNEMKTKLEKKLQDLRNIEAEQSIKLTKLHKDEKNIRAVLLSRQTEEENLRNLNEELSKEYRRIKNSLLASNVEFSKTLEDLERRVKEAYQKVEQAKDLKDILEMGLTSLKEEDRMLLVNDVLRRKKRRQEELDSELTHLDMKEKRLEEDFKIRTGQLEGLKEKNSELHKKYIMYKKKQKEEVKKR